MHLPIVWALGLGPPFLGPPSDTSWHWIGRKQLGAMKFTEKGAKCEGWVRSCRNNHGVHHLEKTEQAAADRMMRIWQHHHEPDSSGERSSADTAGVGVSGKGIAVVLAVAAAVRANAA